MATPSQQLLPMASTALFTAQLQRSIHQSRCGRPGISYDNKSSCPCSGEVRSESGFLPPYRIGCFSLQGIHLHLPIQHRKRVSLFGFIGTSNREYTERTASFSRLQSIRTEQSLFQTSSVSEAAKARAIFPSLLPPLRKTLLDLSSPEQHFRHALFEPGSNARTADA